MSSRSGGPNVGTLLAIAVVIVLAVVYGEAVWDYLIHGRY
jgi:hypothetical protein